MTRKKIFISSVQNEFQQERRMIADYIRQDALLSIYFEPFLFEELPAQDKSAQEAYLEQAAHSDVYLLLMGEQYGFLLHEPASASIYSLPHYTIFCGKRKRAAACDASSAVNYFFSFPIFQRSTPLPTPLRGS